jgi:hypothetical protein
MYLPVAQTMASANPMPAAFVLGGISCLLSVPSRFLDFQEKIADMLWEMGESFSLLTEYGDLYQSDANLQQLLIELFGDIFDFCREASKLLYDKDGLHRDTSKMIFKSLWQDYEMALGSIAKRFHRHFDMFQKRATLVNTTTASRYQALAVQAYMQQSQNNQDIMGTLSSIHEQIWVESRRRDMQATVTRSYEWFRRRGESGP